MAINLTYTEYDMPPAKTHNPPAPPPQDNPPAT